MRKHRKSNIPVFHSYKEEARFWDSHSASEFLDELEPVKVQFPKPRKKLISLRLPEPEIIGLKRIAAKKGIGYLTLMRIWVTERFFEELKKTG